MFSSCPHISFNTICKQSAFKLYIEQHLTARTQHFDTWRVTLFPLASYRSCFSPFLVIPFYASGCTWSHCTATRAHTPRPGWSSSQNVLRSVPSSPVGFPYYAVCRWELQWRHSTLRKKREKNMFFFKMRILCVVTHLLQFRCQNSRQHWLVCNDQEEIHKTNFWSHLKKKSTSLVLLYGS